MCKTKCNLITLFTKRMKRFLLFIQAAVLLFTLQSCIQDEDLNAECDIEGVDPTWLGEHPGMVIGNPLVNQEKRTIDFTLEKGTDRTALNPRFLLSDAATITAEVDGQTVNGNGITRNFKTPQTYTTHSQDGKWQKDYTVSFGYFTGLAAMNFDHYQLDANNKYYIWNEVEAKEDESEPDKPLNWWRQVMVAMSWWVSQRPLWPSLLLPLPMTRWALACAYRPVERVRLAIL